MLENKGLSHVIHSRKTKRKHKLRFVMTGLNFKKQNLHKTIQMSC